VPVCQFTSCVNMPASVTFLLGLLFDPQDGGDVVFWSIGLSLNSMALQLFTVMAVRTSGPT
jgi:hypothetical protein